MPKSAREQTSQGADPDAQTAPGSGDMPAPLTNWEGIPATGVYPPDTDGQVGANHYLQIVNSGTFGSQIRVWDKTGTQLYDYGMNPLWPAGDPCRNYGYGDPVVVYDQINNRFIITQFTFPPSAPFYLCVGVTRAGSPPSNLPSDWNLYTFNVGTKFPDYPKWGVWPDGLYMMAHQFNAAGTAWLGTGVYVFDLAAMEAGNPVTFQYKDLFSANPNYGGMLPSNWMGNTPPPVGSPNYFVEMDFDWYGTQDVATIFGFHTDWVTPANTTFGRVGEIAIPDFNQPVCSATRGRCIDQPGTPVRLEALSDRLMMHAWYRNIGGHETIVVNHTVDWDGLDHAAPRWYELRKTDPSIPPIQEPPPGPPSWGPWSVYQQSTYAPDTDHRWMGGIAMDHVGNMALGYSVSNATSVYPSIRYTGRLATDPLGTMGQGETSIIAGSGSQTGSAARWGDYSAMSVDPVDDCTYWYTQEYIQTTGTANWQTRVASFKFPNCTIGPTGSLSGYVSDASTTAPINGATVTAVGPQTLSTTSNPDGSYALTLPVGTYNVTASAYGYQPNTVTGVVITAGGNTQQNFALTPATMAVVSGYVTDANTGWPLYASIAISGVPGSPIWNDPETGYYSVSLPTGASYDFTVNAWVPGYNPAARMVGPLGGSRTENFALAVNAVTCNAPGYQSTLFAENFDAVTPPAIPAGWAVADVNGTAGNWLTNAGTVHPFGIGTHSAPNLVYFNSWTATTGNDTRLYRTNGLNLSSVPGAQVRLWMYHDTGYTSSNDRVQVQVSTNAGSTWNAVGSPIARYNGSTGWSQHTVDISAYTGVGMTDVRIAFLGISAYGNDVHVDDVVVNSTQCLPQPGGPVVGNVSDANTSAPLNGAMVSNEAGYSVSTMATPDDPNIADGFYTIFSPGGLNAHTAEMSGGYVPDTKGVYVDSGDTVDQDFNLEAGWLSVNPTGLHAFLPLGQQTTLATTLSNNGSAVGNWEVREQDIGFNPAVGPGAPVRTLSGYFSPLLLSQPKPFETKEGDKPIPPRDLPPWTAIANYPVSIMDNTADYFNGKLYSVGGYNGLTLSSGYVYDPGSNTWAPIASMANTRQKPAAAFLNGKLYVTGGWGSGGTPVAALEIYDPASNTWSTGAPNPNPLAASTAVALGGKLYVIGGCDSGACGYNTVNVYNPAANSWSNAAPYPELTSWTACGAIAGKLYCAGGTYGSSESSSTYEYDPAANAWTPKANMLQTQWGMGFTSAGGKLWISGGVTDNFATVTNETFVYDPAGNVWSPEANSNNTLYRGGSACGFYKIGGSSGSFTPVPNSEVYPGLTACGSSADVPWLSELPISGTLGVAAGPFSPLEQTAEMPVKPVEGAAQEVVGAAVSAEIPVPSEIGLASNPFVPTAVLFDNGPLVTHPGGGAGGADASAVQTALGMTVLGYSHAPTTIYRVADDFTFTGAGWQVDQITFFAYQTGSTTTSTIDHLNLRIWNGPPGQPGSSVVWGDTTTNRLVNTTWSNIYRVTDTGLTNTARPVMANTAAVGTFLTPGTYWLDWQTGGTLALGPFAPPVSVLGQTTTGNGLQSSGPGVWNPLVDVGPQGLPFVIEGTALSASQGCGCDLRCQRARSKSARRLLRQAALHQRHAVWRH